MKKQKLFLSVALLSIVAGLASCGEEPSSSDVGSASSEISSSEYIPTPTENLTDAMFNNLKQGFAATFKSQTKYSDGNYGGGYIYDVKVNEGNLEMQEYVAESTTSTVKKTLANDYHYQKDTVNGTETNPLISSVALSVGNTLMYTPVAGRDPYTGENVEVLWAEEYVVNVFNDLSSSDFTRVGTENKFALKLDTPNYVTNQIANRIKRQLLEPNLKWGNTLTNAAVEHFYLLTDGDEIVGYDFELKPYLSSETYATVSSFGSFTATGANVTSPITPLEGKEDPVFKAAIDKLKAQNYRMVQKQSGATITNAKFTYLGMYEVAVEDGKAITYDVYNAKNEKVINFGYYDTTIEEDGETFDCKQGVTEIKGNFYQEYVYAETVQDFLPEFNFSSLLFNKNEEKSVNGKTVYDLNKDIKISLDNDSTNYTSFEIDGYADRTIYMSITIEDDKITIHNQTNKEVGGEDSLGLSMDCEFTDLGQVENLIPESKIKDTIGDLTWTDLVSNREVDLNKVLSNFTKETINAIPHLDPTICLINLDASTATNPCFYVTLYDEQEIYDLIDEYTETLLANGYSYVDSKIPANSDKPAPNFVKNTNVTSPKGKEYSFNISLDKYWNGNPGYEYGQFQMFISYGKAI